MFQSSNPKPTHLKVKRLRGPGLEESEQRHYLVPYRHGDAVLTNHTVALAAAAMAMLLSCCYLYLCM